MDFLCNTCIRLFKSGKKIKNGSKDELVNGFRNRSHLEIELRTCSGNRCPSSMAESFKQKNS